MVERPFPARSHPTPDLQVQSNALSTGAVRRRRPLRGLLRLAPGGRRVEGVRERNAAADGGVQGAVRGGVPGHARGQGPGERRRRVPEGRR